MNLKRKNNGSTRYKVSLMNYDNGFPKILQLIIYVFFTGIIGQGYYFSLEKIS